MTMLRQSGAEFIVREQDLGLLVERVGGRDERAFAALYDATSPLLYGLALRMLGDARAAEGVLCEAYSLAWGRASECGCDGRAALTWLVMMTRDVALRRLRSGGLNEHCGKESESDDGGCAAVADPACVREISRRRGDVHSMPGALSSDERRALELAFFSGLTVGEIARRLNRPVGEIKTHLRQGLMKLREMIPGKSGGSPKAS